MRNEKPSGDGVAMSRWLVVVLLSVIATCLLIQVGVATSSADAQVTGAGADKLFAVAGQITPGAFGLYLVDLEANTICVYQYVPTDRKLKLVAARTTLFDRQLDEYNTQPSPREIKTLVGQHKRLGNTPPAP